MVTRTPGPFDYYNEVYPGVTGDSIRAANEVVGTHAADLGVLAEALRGDERQILQTTEGAITSAVANNPFVASDVARRLAGKAEFAAGCTRLFAADVDTFDTTVDGINESYRAQVNVARHDPDIRSGDQPMSSVTHDISSHLRPRYATALEKLDTDADGIAATLRNGPTDDAVRDLIRQGLIPLAAAGYFPTLVLTSDDLRLARREAVTQAVARMRSEGLLTGPDPGGYYRKWLENAVARGLPVDTLVEIARDHDIRPDDFDVLDDLEEVTDPDGKSYFILSTDINGDDARKAVLMTFLLNAGTDYGTANGGDTDYAETPYSSDEVQRIVDRQAANSWSYDEDVGFVHMNGGRLATTPNSIMIGLGGGALQDVYSLNGGTTFGDSFMINIDDAANDRDAMISIITSGVANYPDDDGEPQPGSNNLDLDRLLHHEERHSEQWANEGYTGFIAGYLGESVDVDWKGWGPFQVPVPHTVEGKDNSYEADAGLTDGGYDE